MAALTFFTRVAPFLLFSRRNPPRIIRYVQQYIPPMVMTILVVYCLADVDWQAAPYGIPELIAVAVVAALHLWRRNALISIFCGTGVYMFMVQSGAVHCLMRGL
jgi:branched-subunit amino acid transport protein AzlD